MKAINWNDNDNEVAKAFWKQNINQLWIPEKFPVSRDLKVWKTMKQEERETYAEVLSGLTGLDREQGDNGMANIQITHDNMHEQAVFAWMNMMEHIHAKSYSYIFSTLISQKKSDYYLGEWVDNQPQLQKKYDKIARYYNKLRDPHYTTLNRYMAMVASVFLETFSFYSGFFYPVFLAGQGKLVASGEIIRKIIQDESIHGSFTGFVAQRLFKELAPADQQLAMVLLNDLLTQLMEIEDEYTETIYSKVNLVKPVKDYIRYNANRALQNLGLNPQYDHGKINAIILNGINSGIINHDFFSTIGEYAVPLNIEDLQDKDFTFDDVEED
jgi:ribonucleoside-diphosphate reductase beta chain